MSLDSICYFPFQKFVEKRIESFSTVEGFYRRKRRTIWIRDVLQSRFTSASFTTVDEANGDNFQFHLELPARWGNRLCRIVGDDRLGSSRVSFVTRSRCVGTRSRSFRRNDFVFVPMRNGRVSWVGGLRFPGNLNPECGSIANRRFDVAFELRSTYSFWT